MRDVATAGGIIPASAAQKAVVSAAVTEMVVARKDAVMDVKDVMDVMDATAIGVITIVIRDGSAIAMAASAPRSHR